jgi:hypothetical protein
MIPTRSAKHGSTRRREQARAHQGGPDEHQSALTHLPRRQGRDDITRFKEELGDYDEARDEFRPHVVVGETTDEQAAKAPSGGQPARRRRKR